MSKTALQLYDEAIQEIEHLEQELKAAKQDAARLADVCQMASDWIERGATDEGDDEAQVIETLRAALDAHNNR